MPYNLSHYRILGVSSGAPWKEIQRRYRILVKQYHPDRNPNDPKAAACFRLVVEAYDAIRRAQVTGGPAPRNSVIVPPEIRKHHPSAPPPEEVSVSLSPEEVLDSLRRAISESTEFPAFAANVKELLTIKENPYSTIQTVSHIILRDVSLTTQILKLINTIFFQTYQRQVHTISSAVMILGFDRIRDLAIGLRLFENFKNPKSLRNVLQLIVLSFLTALQSQEMVGQERSLKQEEVFIIALFFNIGELISAFYFPEQYKKILTLTEVDHLNKRDAGQQVLKLTMDDLGLAVLRDWEIPERIVQRLSVLHKNGGEAQEGELRLREIVKAAHTLSKNALDPDITPEIREKQKERICRTLGLRLPALAQSLETSTRRLREMARILKIDLRKVELMESALSQDPQQEASLTTEIPAKELSPAPLEETQGEVPAISSSKADMEAAESFKGLQFIYQVLEEISKAIVSKESIHQIMLMILEGIIRGIRFDRVIFCVVERQRTQISARFGLGEGVDDLLPLLSAPLHSKTKALSLALTEHRDYLLDPEARPRDRFLIDGNFWQVSGARSCLISPILVDQKAIGAIYVDRHSSRLPITVADRQRLRLFRDQMIVAIRLSTTQF